MNKRLGSCLAFLLPLLAFAVPAASGDLSAERFAQTPPIVGTSDAVGWGNLAAQTIKQGHITWNRVDPSSPTNTMSSSLSAGFKVLLIAGNSSDSQPLSQIVPSQWGTRVTGELRANPGASIAEAGNEPYLKGGVAEPAQYARMYMAAIEDLKAAGIHTPLLFNMYGDYLRGTSWSLDASGGGWLRDALAAAPGLAKAILANGVAIHPYGEVGENRHDDYGLGAITAEEGVTRTLLGAIPAFYVTEFGYSLRDCGRDLGACSKREQAGKLEAAYSVMLADPHIAGIWWYQSHDDGTGRFGFMNRNNTARPAFKALSAIAAGTGQ